MSSALMPSSFALDRSEPIGPRALISVNREPALPPPRVAVEPAVRPFSPPAVDPAPPLPSNC